ncbi:unknown [Sinorhizobium phage PBC5]|nr:unknown [Sinorhizobium phage PBC5]
MPLGRPCRIRRCGAAQRPLSPACSLASVPTRPGALTTTTLPAFRPIGPRRCRARRASAITCSTIPSPGRPGPRRRPRHSASPATSRGAARPKSHLTPCSAVSRRRQTAHSC